jgi:aspartyl-tRNA(Asn)/glutamyl-tRNA(Gln) amidotransferase subunit A
LPALSVPAGFGAAEDGTQMPVGLQIIGPQWGEQKVFDIGHAYQQVTDWHKKYPKQFAE